MRICALFFVTLLRTWSSGATTRARRINIIDSAIVFRNIESVCRVCHQGGHQGIYLFMIILFISILGTGSIRAKIGR